MTLINDTYSLFYAQCRIDKKKRTTYAQSGILSVKRAYIMGVQFVVYFSFTDECQRFGVIILIVL